MVQVVIVGGGFAGMALALSLKKQNVTSAIYELRDEKFSSGGNIALAPNALRVLDSLGLFERIRTQGYNYDNLSFANANGVILGAFSNGSQKRYHYHALRIHRVIVFEELRAEIARHGIPIYYNKKCAAVEEDAKGVTVTFTDESTATGDFVIGADGMHSKVRQHLNKEAPTYAGLTGIMGYVDASELGSLLVHPNVHLPAMLFGETGSFAIIPSSYSGDEVGYFASLDLKDRSREEWSKLGASQTDLRAILDQRFRGKAHWPPLIQSIIEKTPDGRFSCWPFFQAPTLEHYYSPSGRVIVIGDAAHAISPTGGQGAAMALEDAATLSYAIGLLLSPADASPDATVQAEKVKKMVAAWEKHRRARIQKVIDFTSKNGKLRQSTAHYVEQAAKEWLMWISMKWSGEEGGAGWMYEYSPEQIRADLV